MRLALAFAAVAAVAACGPAPAPPAPPKPPTACARASDRMVNAMLARLPAGDPVPTERADGLRNLIRERCEHDAWSAEATQCLIGMAKLEDAEPCARLLTDEQQAALARDGQAMFGPGPGSESSPPPPPGPGSSSR